MKFCDLKNCGHFGLSRSLGPAIGQNSGVSARNWSWFTTSQDLHGLLPQCRSFQAAWSKINQVCATLDSSGTSPEVVTRSGNIGGRGGEDVFVSVGSISGRIHTENQDRTQKNKYINDDWSIDNLVGIQPDTVTAQLDAAAGGKSKQATTADSDLSDTNQGELITAVGLTHSGAYC